MSVTTSNRKNIAFSMRTSAPVRTGRELSVSPPENDNQQHIQSQARTSRLRPFSLLSAIPSLIVAGLVLVVWYILTTPGHISDLFLPAPADVFSSLSAGLASGVLLSNALITVEESVLGFLLALAIALPLGYGLAKSRLLALTLHPYIAAGQAIPAIVIAPFFSLWLGYGLLPNMLVCTLVVFFPILVNTILGVQTIDSTLTDAARVEGASGWSLLASIEFPLALPALLAAIRTGFTLSIVGALVGEFVGGSQGLGALVLMAKNQFNTPFMFATVLVLAALAALYYGITWLLTKVAEAVY
ncbi:MAG: ABC transporter permease subunit [Ktedonobacteraceae bacterium]|nr:ABC transporter permease subunit [Ktedonobacteraceae bacterium]